MKKFVSVFLSLALIVASLCAVACATPPPAKANVTFTVAQSSVADPVYEVGATVTFTNAGGETFSGTTDENGQFSLELAAGEYTVSAENLSYGFSLDESKVTVNTDTTAKTLTAVLTLFDLSPNAEGKLCMAIDGDTVVDTVTVPAGKTYVFNAARSNGRICTINSDSAIVTYNNEQITPVSGNIVFTFDGDVSDTRRLQTFAVTNPTAANITISFVLSEIPSPDETPDFIGGGDSNIDTIG